MIVMEPNTSTLVQPTGVTTNGQLEISIHEDWDAVEGNRSSWESILCANPILTIFATPEWVGSWWKAYGTGRQLVSLVLRDKTANVVGIIPLYRELMWQCVDHCWHGVRLVGDGSGDSDNLDFPLLRGYETVCANSIMAWLGQQSNWAVCRFNTLPQNSQAFGPILDEVCRRHWPHNVTAVPQWHIPLPRSWEEYLERLSPEFRPLLTRYPNRLASRYNCEVVKCRTQGDLDQYLPVLFYLHQQRWQQAGKPGSFSSPERRAFYRHMSSAFLQRGWLEFWIMKLNSTPVAAQFCFQYRNSVYLLQEGFDPKFAKDKVGYALRAKMLQHFIQCGIERYDFLGGTQAHKLKFGAVKNSYQNLHFAKPRTLGGIAISLSGFNEQARAWLRNTIPSEVRSRVRTTLEAMNLNG